MKRRILLLIVLCAFPLHAFAQGDDECILQMDALKPVMREGLENYTLKISEEERSITETITLDDGLKITYTAGGCAHYAYSFHFENIPGGVPEMPIDPFGLPQSLLRRVPMRDEAQFQHLRETLWEKEASGYTAFDEDNRTEWSCGDAFCSLILNGSEDVTISYDFAL